MPDAYLAAPGGTEHTPLKASQSSAAPSGGSRGENRIFPKPLPAKGNRCRLGLLSQCLVLVVGVAPHPTVFLHPHKPIGQPLKESGF